jgi:DNA-binding LacI/PurR family transcriptional regulator
MAREIATTIVAELRQGIVTGRYQPGARLPTRVTLQEQYGVSPTTMQRAFDTLLEDGFIETRGKQGTFVSHRAPHLTHYAVVLHGRLETSRLYRAIAGPAMALARDGRRVSCYQQVDAHRDSPDYRRLLADLRCQRVAGLLFSTHPWEYASDPLMTTPGIPRTAFMSQRQYPHVAAFSADHASFRERALHEVARRGLRRVACLSHHTVPELAEAVLLPAAARHGLEVRPSWLQFADLQPGSAAQIARLLVDQPAATRPQALIVADDNLVEDASRGLAAAGLAPAELLVIGAANFPAPPPSHFPVLMLGFDLHALVAAAFAEIDRQRQGAPPPPGVQLFPALFEAELPLHPAPAEVAS